MDTFAAMQFARERHAGQKRKYTGAPYTDHLAEVAGIVAATFDKPGSGIALCLAVCIAWLHDTLEDTYSDKAAGMQELALRFGFPVADSVWWLSDLEEGNRTTRKAASRARLANAPGWVQTIKVADMISNTSSIVLHDPAFAVVYLEEKRLLLDVLTKADPRLVRIAHEQVAA